MSHGKQVGGDHYQHLKVSPYDYAYENHLDCFQFNVVKYVTRFRHKNGREDLEKAIDTLQQLIEKEYGGEEKSPSYGDATTSDGRSIEEIICGI